MAEDYGYLRSKDECAAILICLSQSELWMSEADIAKALGRRKSVVLKSSLDLMRLRLIDYTFDTGERYFFLTDKGKFAVEQLNT